MGWWRYRIPGLGQVDFRDYVDALYEGGFDGVLSVEHEDPVWGGTPEMVEAGLRIAHTNLRAAGGGMSETKVLEVRNLVKEYPGRAGRCDGVDLDVLAGEVHCLLGPNGAGKSTLIKCVSGAVEPTSGEILFVGEPLPPGDPAGSLRRGVATIYQELDLVADLSVAREHLPRPRAAARAAARPRADVPRVGGAARAARARVDPRAREGREAAARRAADRLDRARALARRAPADHGRAVGDPRRRRDRARSSTSCAGSPTRASASSTSPTGSTRSGAIGDRVTVLADGRTAATGLPATTSTDELVELMVGRKVEQLYPDRPVGTDEVLLDVRDVRRLPAVRGVSLQVRAGEVVGLGGLVGSGRTELLRLIYGLDPLDSGEVCRREAAAGRAIRAPRSARASGSRRRTASRRRSSSTGARRRT